MRHNLSLLLVGLALAAGCTESRPVEIESQQELKQQQEPPQQTIDISYPGGGARIAADQTSVKPDDEQLTPADEQTNSSQLNPPDQRQAGPVEQLTEAPAAGGEAKRQSSCRRRNYCTIAFQTIVQTKEDIVSLAHDFRDYVVSELEYKLVLKRLQKQLCEQQRREASEGCNSAGLDGETGNDNDDADDDADSSAAGTMVKADSLGEYYTNREAQNQGRQKFRPGESSEADGEPTTGEPASSRAEPVEPADAPPETEPHDSALVGQCLICLEQFQKPAHEGYRALGSKFTTVLFCRHKFHRLCLEDWILYGDQASKRCPVCSEALQLSGGQPLRLE